LLKANPFFFVIGLAFSSRGAFFIVFKLSLLLAGFERYFVTVIIDSILSSLFEGLTVSA
jgi:hypothetical protein